MPRRFSARDDTIQRELQLTLRKMAATGLKITQDFETGEATIQFDRDGKRYIFHNESFDYPADNLRATQLTIKLLYQALETYGTTSTEERMVDPFTQFFAGFQALPDDSVLMLPSGRRDWWEVLGLSRSATKADIRNAYRALAFEHHPDHGGDPEVFKRLNDAYKAAMAAA